MPKGLHIDRWTRGLVTNRAATSTPFKYASIGNPVVFHDALIDGSNVEISPANTLVRRPGFPKYCTATYNAEVPKGFFSSILNGSLYKFFNTDQKVYLFDTTTLTSVYTKTTTAQSFFQQVGNTVFFSDGAANKKFTVGTSSDTSVTNAGITAPTQAPSIPNLNFYDTVGATQTVHAWVPNVQPIPTVPEPHKTSFSWRPLAKFNGRSFPQARPFSLNPAPPTGPRSLGCLAEPPKTVQWFGPIAERSRRGRP
jgi:hypothetical protein